MSHCKKQGPQLIHDKEKARTQDVNRVNPGTTGIAIKIIEKEKLLLRL